MLIEIDEIVRRNPWMFRGMNPTSWETIQRYRGLPGATAPPIIVSPAYELHDGFHRTWAARLRGQKLIRATILP